MKNEKRSRMYKSLFFSLGSDTLIEHTLFELTNKAGDYSMEYRMMLKCILSAAIISICNLSHGSSPNPMITASSKTNDQAMQFVKMVQRRYYLVHRLEKPVSFLIEFYRKFAQKRVFNVWTLSQTCSLKELVIPQGIWDQFKHPLVIKHMKDLEKKRSIYVLNDLWSDFLSYKYIEDELFVRETILAIVLMYKAVALSLDDTAPAKNQNLFIPPSIKRNMMEDSKELYENFHSILNLLDESYVKEDFVITNNLRHYHIQRLLKSIIILTKVNAIYLRPLWECLNTAVHDHAITFNHKSVQECLESILLTKSLSPLFGLWRHFMAYRLVNDPNFLHDFIALEYMLYFQLIECLRIDKLKDTQNDEDLMDLYTTITTLSIPEMLSSLDSLVEELITIMEKYELDAPISWMQWFKKYWWIPPVMISTILINFSLDQSLSKITNPLS